MTVLGIFMIACSLPGLLALPGDWWARRRLRKRSQ